MERRKSGNNQGLWWQLLTGKGPIGQVFSAIGSILFGLTIIGMSEFIYYASSQVPDPALNSRSSHPPSRVETPEERQGFRTISDCVGVVVLLRGVRTLLLAAEDREP